MDEYLDENKDPNLEIAKGEDGKYIVQIGIFRLASMGDGVGELTEEGMHFTATDMAGNPISGIITMKGKMATVTFTDSTWELIENGTSLESTAKLVGFSDYSSFFRAFKQEYGISPRQYRKIQSTKEGD